MMERSKSADSGSANRFPTGRRVKVARQTGTLPQPSPVATRVDGEPATSPDFERRRFERSALKPEHHWSSMHFLHQMSIFHGAMCIANGHSLISGDAEHGMRLAEKGGTV